jgi:dipeptidyl aminopeptidase/acylaminoacyl peptidase
VMPLGRNGSIAYFWQGNNHSGRGAVVMNADGTGFQTLAGGFCPSFSANGNVLAYVLDDSTTVVAHSDGSAPQHVAEIHASYNGLGPDSGHALSPDGKQIAWWSPRDELWVSPTAGGDAIRVVLPSGDPHEVFLAPAWSPDSHRIAFARVVSVGEGDTASEYRSAIDVVDADGSNLRHLTTRVGTTDLGLAWSPDGRSIAYTGLQDGSPIPAKSPDGFYPPSDIFVINADGTGERSLTSTPGDESQPAWSPDGTRLAWVTQLGDAGLLTSVRMDAGTPLGSPIQGPESGWFTWSPDGTALLFAGLRAGGLRGDALMLVDPDFRLAPTTLRDIDGTLLCPPSWQRLNP